jgi:hypothetical protein
MVSRDTPERMTIEQRSGHHDNPLPDALSWRTNRSGQVGTNMWTLHHGDGGAYRGRHRRLSGPIAFLRRVLHGLHRWHHKVYEGLCHVTMNRLCAAWTLSV